ncbi:MAG: glycyl radical protein, partial [Promethearchaeota archaeon]
TSPHEICIERAKIFTESYKKTRDQLPYIRFAKAMEKLLKEMTIIIWDDEYIIGNRCTKFIGTPLYPEVRIDTIEQDIDTYDNRKAQKLFISEEDKAVLKSEIIPYWKNDEKTLKERFLSTIPPEIKEKVDTLVFTIETEVTNGIGHFMPGHKNILKDGLDGLIQKIENKIALVENNDQMSLALSAMLIVLKAAKCYIKRFSELAFSMAQKEQDIKRKKELLEISNACNNISGKPPKNFKEAIQLIYFTQVICGLEDGGFAISIGRLDQYLYPFYINDIKNNTITKEEVKFLIECFFLKLNTLWNYVFYLGVNAAEGPPIAENLTIGGLDARGQDATNELSYIILEAYSNLKTVQPTFSVRVHEKTSDDFLLKVGEVIKQGTSLALFNDEIMIKGLVNRGFTIEDAREYAPIGCVEPQHPHKSFGSTNANQFNIVKCLELALNNGTDVFLRREIGLKFDSPITSYQELWHRFIENMKYFIKYMVDAMYYLDKAIAEIKPQPFLSTTIDDCIERGLDITQGGAVYDFTGPQMIGLATAADSLAVIKKIVFEQNLLSLDDMVTILKRNFKGTYRGKTGKEWQEIFINKVPKFCNDEDYVDEIAVEIVKSFCEEIARHDNFRGGKFNPGIYSTSLHLAFGSFTGASADGRRSREPLSNGVGPTHGRDKNGPTAILNSIKKLDNSLQTNGNSLILSFHPTSFKIELFPSLIRSFFTKDGGYHIQFNVVGKDTLLDAQKHPEKHVGLVVRIAGYSVLFNELSENAQNEIIARTEY